MNVIANLFTALLPAAVRLVGRACRSFKRRAALAFLAAILSPQLLAVCASPNPNAVQRVYADFNGDCRSDVLWKHTDGTVFVWLMNGTTIAGTGIPANVGSPSLGWQALGIGDFDGDGKADIIWKNSISGDVVVWLMSGTSIVSAGLVAGLGPNAEWEVRGVGDFNGDGKSDVLWKHADGTVLVWLMNGTTIAGTGVPAYVGATSQGWQAEGVGDFDRDGKADILWKNSLSGDVVVWLMNGTNIVSAPSVAGLGPNTGWEVQGIGDFNGDGRADVLWKHTDGTVLMWLMNGASIASTGLAPNVGTANFGWQVVGVGDYNGDTRADILWRNSLSGEVVVWLMNGATLVGYGSPATVTDPSWQTQPSRTTAAVTQVVNLSSGIPSKGYLETGQLSLGDLDAALALEAGLVVSQASGPAMEFKLVGSTLYFLSPVQQFSDTASVVKFTNANSTKSWLVTLRWSGRVSPALSRISEADESGKAPPDLVTLLPNGVGPTGGVSASTTQGLSFTLQNAPATDPANSMISLHTSTGSQDVTSQFTYSNGKYTLAPAQLSNFLATVQTAKTASLSFSLSTPDDLKTFGFEQVLVSSGGTLQVGVVNAGGSPATEFAGVRFVARGFNSGFAVLGQLDANARVSFTGLPADTYDVTQVLLGPGIPLVGFGTLPSSNSFVSLTIIKVPGAVTQAGADGETTIEANAVASPFNFETAKAVILSDEPVTLAPRVPDLTFAPLAGTSGLAVASALDYAIAVTSGAADTLVTSPVSFIAPKGSTQLSVRVVVTSAEYPVFTGQQSKFNDIWLFNIQIPALARSLQQTGKVNQSHATSGTISFDTCLDLTSAATNADVSVTGQIGAQNVVDSLYPTSVSVSISLSCQGTLKLTQFSGKATTPDGLFSLFPRKKGNAEATPDGNVSGQYISIPRIVRLPSSFGIPATIQYAPADVTITGVEIFQRAGGQDVSLGANYLAQGNASKPGVIEFSGLLLDPTLVTPLSGQVQLVARLRGIRQGSAVVSDLVPLTVDDKYSSFTPIYLTNELTGYDNLRRFGSNHNEPGGDSWATFAMATWVFGEALPYNDVSAASVKQLSAPEYGSVLEHAGHSDAQQVDVRYWDGAGGFTDPLSGNNLGKGILDLALAALAEVNSNANPKVSLPRLVAWITENRTKIALYANRANVRRVHIGDAHIKQLLVDGRFPGSTTFVPGLSAQKWKQMGMPDKISWQDKHLDHWHISTYNP